MKEPRSRTTDQYGAKAGGTRYEREGEDEDESKGSYAETDSQPESEKETKSVERCNQHEDQYEESKSAVPIGGH